MNKYLYELTRDAHVQFELNGGASQLIDSNGKHIVYTILGENDCQYSCTDFYALEALKEEARELQAKGVKVRIKREKLSIDEILFLFQEKLISPSMVGHLFYRTDSLA